MEDDREVTVTVTQEDMEFRAQARAAGLPDIIISMYGTALKRLVADEREACAKVCMEIEQSKPLSDRVGWEHGTVDCQVAIRARSKE
jgi:hypothetical protein